MGQSQSSNTSSHHAAENAGQTKTDYYELLGLDRQATDEEIKKAYRRKALELHPDRNYGNVEHATKVFAGIQTAYDVLSDAQERAWYDSHRDVFLRGSSQSASQRQDEFLYNIRMTTADDVVKLMMRYNGRLDYSNSTSGFYGGLRDFFGHLAKEEELACRWDNLDPVEYPDFGLKDDDYNDVVRPFYAAWNGFATRKSYTWKDHYRLSEAPDRRVRRLMEKENKGVREEAIREYNDAVRSLIAFVRKRDPRYQGNQKSEEDRQKILRDAAAAQSARSRAAREAKLGEIDRFAVPEWARSTRVDEHEGEFSTDGESEQHEIECVVCRKNFKSEAQYEAHERSKKHIKLLKQLRRDMRDQDKQIDNDNNDKKASPNSFDQSIFSSDEEGPMVSDGLPGDEDDHLHRHKADMVGLEKRLNGDNRVYDTSSFEMEQSSHEKDDDNAPPFEEVESRFADRVSEALAVLQTGTVNDETAGASDTDVPSVPRLGKAKQRRAKRAAQKHDGQKDSTGSDLRCALCEAGFPSKTKLFNHIKDKGHATPVAATSSANSRAATVNKSKKTKLYGG